MLGKYRCTCSQLFVAGSTFTFTPDEFSLVRGVRLQMQLGEELLLTS
jgi:hypothetical protein